MNARAVTIPYPMYRALLTSGTAPGQIILLTPSPKPIVRIVGLEIPEALIQRHVGGSTGLLDGRRGTPRSPGFRLAVGGFSGDDVAASPGRFRGRNLRALGHHNPGMGKPLLVNDRIKLFGIHRGKTNAAMRGGRAELFDALRPMDGMTIVGEEDCVRHGRIVPFLGKV